MNDDLFGDLIYTRREELQLRGLVVQAELIEREGIFDSADDRKSEPPRIAELRLRYADGREISLRAGTCECCGIDWQPLIEKKPK